MTMQLDVVRKEVERVLSASFPELNAYSYPEPQPEYPCWRIGFIDTMLLHQSHCREGGALDVVLEVLVADPDVENATKRLEAIIGAGIVEVLEDAASDAWSSLLASEIRNFQQLDDVNGLACDVVLRINS